jgi:hypothetical protein
MLLSMYLKNVFSSQKAINIYLYGTYPYVCTSYCLFCFVINFPQNPLSTSSIEHIYVYTVHVHIYVKVIVVFFVLWLIFPRILYPLALLSILSIHLECINIYIHIHICIYIYIYVYIYTYIYIYMYIYTYIYKQICICIWIYLSWIILKRIFNYIHCSNTKRPFQYIICMYVCMYV